MSTMLLPGASESTLRQLSEYLRRLLTEYAEGMLIAWAFTGGHLLTGPRFLSLVERLGESHRRVDPSVR